MLENLFFVRYKVYFYERKFIPVNKLCDLQISFLIFFFLSARTIYIEYSNSKNIKREFLKIFSKFCTICSV